MMPRNTAKGIGQAREEVTEQELNRMGVNFARDFPGQSLTDLRKYPVLSEGGWYITVKNQVTLQEIARLPWRLLGPVELLSNKLVLD